MPSPFPSGSSDAIAFLKQHYPLSLAQLEAEGYEVAGDNTLGRCQTGATLFLELNHRSGQVVGWVWDLASESYVGGLQEVHGPLGPAVEQARHLVEATYAQDRLSGGVSRYQSPPRELSFVTLPDS